MSYALFLDDIRTPISTKHVDLPPYNWVVVKSYDEFVKTIIKRGIPFHISFDHDLANEHYSVGRETAFTQFDYSKVKEKTGFHCAKWLVDYCLDKRLPLPSWQVHSMNPCGKENIEKLLNGFEKFQQKDKNEQPK
jgi:hypothetical protein